jgi:PAS domain S-box-containing protein
MLDSTSSTQPVGKSVNELRRGILEAAVTASWLKKLKAKSLYSAGKEALFQAIAQVFLDAIFSNDLRMPRDCAVVLCELLESILFESEPCLRAISSLYSEICKQLCGAGDINEDTDVLLDRATNLMALTCMRIKGNPPSQDLEYGARDALNRIQWLLQKSLGTTEGDSRAPQPYGDLSLLDTNRVILEAVGDSLLKDILDDGLNLLETSAAIFESNGDCALNIKASKWCRFMDEKSRQLAPGDNREAIESGQWHCNQSCRETSMAAIASGMPADQPCNGGIRIFAVPIKAGNDIVGSINIGYGDPPKDEAVLEELAQKYGTSKDELAMQAQKYHCRPPFIIEQSKKRLLTAAHLIGEIVERRRSRLEIQKLNTMLKERINELEPAERERLKLADIVEQSNDAIFSVDLEGSVMSWNKGAEKIYGFTAGEMIGNSIYIIMPNGTDAQAEEIKRLVLAGTPPQMFETLHTRKDGVEIPVALTISCIRDEKEKIAEVSVISRDITERKKSEEALRKFSRDLERSNNELKQFAFAAAHDLQEPLRAMSNYSDLLTGRYAAMLDDRAVKYINRIAESSERMQALIQDLLHYSRVDTHGKPFAVVNLEEVFLSSTKNLRMAIEESGAIVIAGKLPRIQADRSQMLLLFQNLISNAIKYRGKEIPEISIDAKLENGLLTLHFKDNGIGIEQEHFDRIFVIFQRLHTRDEYPGTGMGLAICKRIVDRHGGTIWVESQVGKGCDFFVQLPEIQTTETTEESTAHEHSAR